MGVDTKWLVKVTPAWRACEGARGKLESLGAACRPASQGALTLRCNTQPSAKLASLFQQPLGCWHGDVHRALCLIQVVKQDNNEVWGLFGMPNRHLERDKDERNCNWCHVCGMMFYE